MTTSYVILLLCRIYEVILITVGTVGNILTILVFCKKCMFRKRAAIYFIALAVADVAALHLHLLPGLIKNSHTERFTFTTAGMCKFTGFSSYFSGDIPIWILVIMTLERTLTVCGYQRWRLSKTKQSALIGISLIVVASFVVNSHMLYGYTTVVSNGTSYCGYNGSEEYLYFVEHAWFWIDLVKYSAIPFVFVVICDAFLIVSMIKTKRSLTEVSTAQDNSGINETSTIYIMLIATSCQLLVTTLPVTVYHVSLVNVHESSVLMNVLNLLAVSNNGLNFCTYCLSARKFRSELALMLKRQFDEPPVKLSTPNTSPTTVDLG